MNDLRKQKNSKTQKGITLIALIITIIVMIILVGVSVSIALNNGLFKATQSAAKNTEIEKIKETELSGGKVTIGGTTYNTLEEYVAGSNNADVKIGDYVLYANKSSWIVANINSQGQVVLYNRISQIEDNFSSFGDSWRASGATTGQEYYNTYLDGNFAKNARSWNLIVLYICFNWEKYTLVR